MSDLCDTTHRFVWGCMLRCHADNVAMLADQDRWATPALPRGPAQLVKSAQGPSAGEAPVSKLAARAVVALRAALLPRLLQPSVECILVFLKPDGQISSSWFIAMRHYSQLWAARATLAPRDRGYIGSVCPGDIRKLLFVIDRELAHSLADVSGRVSPLAEEYPGVRGLPRTLFARSMARGSGLGDPVSKDSRRAAAHRSSRFRHSRTL